MDDLKNMTIQVPPGATQHGNNRILCVYGPGGKTILSIATFFATNYIAHAATIKSTPGETTTITVCNIFLALLFPMSGLMRALNAVARLARSGGSELKNACRAGALCMVVRAPDWRPLENEELEGTIVDFRSARMGPDIGARVHSAETSARLITYAPLSSREDSSVWAYFDTIGSRVYVDLSYTRIHGEYALPPGYTFATVPRNTALRSLETVAGGTVGCDVSSSYSIAKAVASIIQTLAAFATLLGHQSDLVARYGYASFHLTVVPYLVMTIINFLANSVTADYPCLYMVESETMNEARRRNGIFTGTVAGTYPASSAKERSQLELSTWKGLKKSDMKKAASFFTGNIIELQSHLEDALRKKQSSQRRHVRLQRIPNDQVSLEEESKGEFFLLERDISNHAKDVLTGISSKKEISILANFNDETSTHEHSHQIETVVVRDFASREVRSKEETKYRIRSARPMKGKKSNIFQRPNLLSSNPSNAGDEDQVIQGAKSETKSVSWAERAFRFELKLATTICESSMILYLGREPFTLITILVNAYRISEILEGELDRTLSIAERARILHDTIRDREWRQSGDREPLINIYVPSCECFLREDDFQASVDQATVLVSHGSLLGAVPRVPSQSPRPRGNAGRGMAMEVFIGLLVLGLTFSIIGWQSDWFSPGNSSKTEKVIMLLWISEGTFGMVFPFLSMKELLMVVFVLPWYIIGGGQALRNYFWLLGFSPLGLFVAPIWGFVLVGVMQKQWGNCVTLY